MLKNLHSMATDDCLLGVTVWGDKNRNNLMKSIREAILESGATLPEERSPFYLHEKVGELAACCGWETVLDWDQNALFPVLSADKKYEPLIFFQINKVSE